MKSSTATTPTTPTPLHPKHYPIRHPPQSLGSPVTPALRDPTPQPPDALHLLCLAAAGTRPTQTGPTHQLALHPTPLPLPPPPPPPTPAPTHLHHAHLTATPPHAAYPVYIPAPMHAYTTLHTHSPNATYVPYGAAAPGATAGVGFGHVGTGGHLVHAVPFATGRGMGMDVGGMGVVGGYVGNAGIGGGTGGGRGLREGNGGAMRKVKGPWRPEEDRILTELVGRLGARRWTVIASHIVGRTGKQARERWLNQLSPDLAKRAWTAEEDRIVMQAHARLGNRWSEIAKLLKGRTDNATKNRFNTTIRRQISELSCAARAELAKEGEEGVGSDVSSEEGVGKKRKLEGREETRHQRVKTLSTTGCSSLSD